MANKITLSIAGFNLIVNTTEDEDYVRGLNTTLNSDLQAILTQNQTASVTNAALLCALDYLDRFEKANHSANNLRSQIKDYLADAAEAKLQHDEEARKNADLAAEIQTLRSHLTKLATEGAGSSAAEATLRRELDTARNECETVRAQLREQAEQSKAAADKAAAMNDFIAGQEKELKRLSELTAQQAEVLEQQTRQIFSFEQSDSGTAAERDALRGQLAAAETEKSALAAQLQNTQTECGALRAAQQALQASFDQLRAAMAAPELYPAAAPASPESEPLPFRDLSEFEPIDLPAEQPAQPEAAEDALPQQPVIQNALLPSDFPGDAPAAPAQEPAQDSPARDEAAAPSTEMPRTGENGELGVGEGFKTFGQMIAEELGRGKAPDVSAPYDVEYNYNHVGFAPQPEPQQQAAAEPAPQPAADPDDDGMPNLSWINDI